MFSVPSGDGLMPLAGVPASEPPEGLMPMRRLAYTVLPPTMGRRRRARLADALARQALELGETRLTARAHLIREVLHAGRNGGWVPAPLARLGETSTAASRATEKALGAMVPAARAAYALLHLENLSPAQATALLDLAGVQDAATSVSIAERNPLDPEAMRALVVPVPTAAISPRLVGLVGAGLVLLVAAPVVAATAFDGDSSSDQRVSNSQRLDQREAAATAAKAGLKDRADNAVGIAEMDQSFQRILRQLNNSLDDKGLSHKAERRLRSLKQAIIQERDRLEG
jgi:hypothetical protein